LERACSLLDVLHVSVENVSACLRGAKTYLFASGTCLSH
jgi:hypothetical protein